jgi:rubrerythrin
MGEEQLVNPEDLFNHYLDKLARGVAEKSKNISELITRLETDLENAKLHKETLETASDWLLALRNNNIKKLFDELSEDEREHLLDLAAADDGLYDDPQEVEEGKKEGEPSDARRPKRVKEQAGTHPIMEDPSEKKPKDKSASDEEGEEE